MQSTMLQNANKNNIVFNLCSSVSGNKEDQMWANLFLLQSNLLTEE